MQFRKYTQLIAILERRTQVKFGKVHSENLDWPKINTKIIKWNNWNYILFALYLIEKPAYLQRIIVDAIKVYGESKNRQVLGNENT